MATTELLQGDCVNIPLDDNSVDLVFCSPPYEAARTYGIDFKLKGQEYVDWCAERFMEHLRVCRGLVAWVIEGQTRKFRYSTAPVLLMADLHRRGVHLRKPPIFHRVGIPGSGGPDWLRNDWEFIICATSGGKLPWSDNTAMGHPPKYGPGGAMSNRNVDGKRKNESAGPKAKQRWANRNQWGASAKSTGCERLRDGTRRIPTPKPSHVFRTKDDHEGDSGYDAPKKANPGNVIKCNVGGGHMGSKIAHKNEAPFPESLAEFFIKSFCPPGGTVLDPFCGSGTTLAVAKREGRDAIGMDIRDSQIELSNRRVQEVSHV